MVKSKSQLSSKTKSRSSDEAQGWVICELRYGGSSGGIERASKSLDGGGASARSGSDIFVIWVKVSCKRDGVLRNSNLLMGENMRDGDGDGDGDGDEDEDESLGSFRLFRGSYVEGFWILFCLRLLHLNARATCLVLLTNSLLSFITFCFEEFH